MTYRDTTKQGIFADWAKLWQAHLLASVKDRRFVWSCKGSE